MSSPYSSYYTGYAITDTVCRSVLSTGGDTESYIYEYTWQVSYLHFNNTIFIKVKENKTSNRFVEVEIYAVGK
jgi:hypothetical protein